MRNAQRRLTVVIECEPLAVVTVEPLVVIAAVVRRSETAELGVGHLMPGNPERLFDLRERAGRNARQRDRFALAQIERNVRRPHLFSKRSAGERNLLLGRLPFELFHSGKRRRNGLRFKIIVQTAVESAKFQTPLMHTVGDRKNVAPGSVARAVQIDPGDQPIPRLRIKLDAMMTASQYLDQRAGVDVELARREPTYVAFDPHAANVMD